MIRIRQFISFALGLLLALTVAQGAFAASTSLKLLPGQSTCVSQYASYSADAQGTATNAGARFTVQRAGVTIYQSPNGTTAFHAVFSPSTGTFPGPGLYSVCAKNNGTTNTTVLLSLNTQ